MERAETFLELSLLFIPICFLFYTILLKSKIKEKAIQELLSFYLISFFFSNAIVYIGKQILKEEFLKNQTKSLIFLLTLMISPSIITFFDEPFEYVSLSKILKVFKEKTLYFGIFIIVLSALLNPLLSSIIWSDVKFSISSETLLNNLKNYNLPETDIESIKLQLNINPLLLVPLIIIQSIIAGISVNAIFAYGEERAWRDFVTKRFFSLGFGFWNTSFISGFLWGLWHYPVILLGYNFPDNPAIGVLVMCISCSLLTPLFIKITLAVPGIMTASILHGVFNATGGFTVLMVSGGIDLQNGILGFSCWILFSFINLMIYFFDNPSSINLQEEEESTNKEN